MFKKIHLVLWMACSAFWIWNALDRLMNDGRSFLYSCDRPLCDVLHAVKGWLFAPALLLLPMLSIALLVRSMRAGVWRRRDLVVAGLAWVSFVYCATFFRS